jgi:uncharacterized membrane protein
VSRLVLVASMTALFIVVAGIIVYPLFATSVFDHFRARTLGAVLLGASLLSLALPSRPGPFDIRVGRWPVAGMGLLGGAAALLDARLPLLLVPSLAWLTAAAVFWGSLSGESSLIERFVALIHPYKPDFVGAYCRRLTSAWAWFFASHGAALAVLVLAAPPSWWEAYTRWVMLPSMLLFSAVEYLIRKTAFRYYPYGGPIDRFFSAWFPAEDTEMGRRSQAYIEARSRTLRGDADPG